MGDDGDLLREQSADVETELDHGGGSAAAAVAAVAVVLCGRDDVTSLDINRSQ